MRLGAGVPTRQLVVAFAALVALLIGAVVLGAALQDSEPPRLLVEAPQRVEAGVPFEVRVSADEPVRYRLRAGDERLEAVEQAWTPTVRIGAGPAVVRVAAEDAAGNVAHASAVVRGVPVPEAQLRVPDEIPAGAPFTVSLRWDAPGAPVRDIAFRVGDRDLPVVRDGAEAFGVAGVPPGAAGSVRVRAEWRDGFGRMREYVRSVRVRPDDRPVEQLTLTPEVLAVSTPEGKQQEARLLAGAHEQAVEEVLWREPFRLPVTGHGTSGFGHARQYGPGGNVSRHQGADVGAPAGTPVYAANAGTVRIAEVLPIRGGFVMIDHGAGVSSHYFHLSALHVAEGEAVSRGDRVGAVGSTGLSTGPHLHWEMRVGETATDPMAWVGVRRP